MSAAWTFDEFVDEFATAVAARAGLQALSNPSVQVFTYYPSMDGNVGDMLVVGHQGRDANEPGAIGNSSHREEVEVDCLISVVRAGAGATPANSARERAMDILDEVSAELRTNMPQVGVDTHTAYVSSRSISQFPSTVDSTAVRECTVTFTIRYQARTAKS